MHVLIKPASGHCQLRCSYCFYLDETEHRDVPMHGMMSEATLEAIIRKACQEAEGQLTLAFQGGEPTLVGLGFFETAVQLANHYAPMGHQVEWAIQTNGLALDDAWCQFFKAHGFLVGLSVDGTRGTHDRHRVGPDGMGSFSAVWAAWQRLQAHGVPTNVLTVVTPYLAERIETVYRFYTERGMLWQQYIPCLNPFEVAASEQTLTAAQYGQFMCTLFDLWYQTITSGQPSHIRTFENWVGMCAGHPPESCGLAGVCVAQHVVEADGTVYPCDFYCVDAYAQGNICDADATFASLDCAAQRFIEESLTLPQLCHTCPAVGLCRGGCKRDRHGFGSAVPIAARGLAVDQPEPTGLNRYCAGMQQFVRYAGPRLEQLSQRVGRM